jgi:hypothetical protein
VGRSIAHNLISCEYQPHAGLVRDMYTVEILT